MLPNSTSSQLRFCNRPLMQICMVIANSERSRYRSVPLYVPRWRVERLALSCFCPRWHLERLALFCIPEAFGFLLHVAETQSRLLFRYALLYVPKWPSRKRLESLPCKITLHWHGLGPLKLQIFDLLSANESSS